eukprot:TRINITY_DN28965_c0_g1_i1.p1 TRINITY_DN28965_c0_g1~~TRINITY_DN28965_c0_g1_i1.p1  ORF type:complete len:2577 (-),score=477.25 TRINITY_DN28965_c0_g1_i1:181-7911(-)
MSATQADRADQPKAVLVVPVPDADAGARRSGSKRRTGSKNVVYDANPVATSIPGNDPGSSARGIGEQQKGVQLAPPGSEPGPRLGSKVRPSTLSGIRASTIAALDTAIQRQQSPTDSQSSNDRRGDAVGFDVGNSLCIGRVSSSGGRSASKCLPGGGGGGARSKKPLRKAATDVLAFASEESQVTGTSSSGEETPAVKRTQRERLVTWAPDGRQDLEEGEEALRQPFWQSTASKEKPLAKRRISTMASKVSAMARLGLLGKRGDASVVYNAFDVQEISENMSNVGHSAHLVRKDEELDIVELSMILPFLTEAERWLCAVQVCCALWLLHSKNFCHGNLSLDSLVVRQTQTEDGLDIRTYCIKEPSSFQKATDDSLRQDMQGLADIVQKVLRTTTDRDDIGTDGDSFSVSDRAALNKMRTNAREVFLEERIQKRLIIKFLMSLRIATPPQDANGITDMQAAPEVLNQESLSRHNDRFRNGSPDGNRGTEEESEHLSDGVSWNSLADPLRYDSISAKMVARRFAQQAIQSKTADRQARKYEEDRTSQMLASDKSLSDRLMKLVVGDADIWLQVKSSLLVTALASQIGLALNRHDGDGWPTQADDLLSDLGPAAAVASTSQIIAATEMASQEDHAPRLRPQIMALLQASRSSPVACAEVAIRLQQHGWVAEAFYLAFAALAAIAGADTQQEKRRDFLRSCARELLTSDEDGDLRENFVDLHRLLGIQSHLEARQQKMLKIVLRQISDSAQTYLDHLPAWPLLLPGFLGKDAIQQSVEQNAASKLIAHFAEVIPSVYEKFDAISYMFSSRPPSRVAPLGFKLVQPNGLLIWAEVEPEENNADANLPAHSHAARQQDESFWAKSHSSAMTGTIGFTLSPHIAHRRLAVFVMQTDSGWSSYLLRLQEVPVGGFAQALLMRLPLQGNSSWSGYLLLVHASSTIERFALPRLAGEAAAAAPAPPGGRGGRSPSKNVPAPPTPKDVHKKAGPAYMAAKTGLEPIADDPVGMIHSTSAPLQKLMMDCKHLQKLQQSQGTSRQKPQALGLLPVDFGNLVLMPLRFSASDLQLMVIINDVPLESDAGQLNPNASAIAAQQMQVLSLRNLPTADGEAGPSGMDTSPQLAIGRRTSSGTSYGRHRSSPLDRSKLTSMAQVSSKAAFFFVPHIWEALLCLEDQLIWWRLPYPLSEGIEHAPEVSAEDGMLIGIEAHYRCELPFHASSWQQIGAKKQLVCMAAPDAAAAQRSGYKVAVAVLNAWTGEVVRMLAIPQSCLPVHNPSGALPGEKGAEVDRDVEWTSSGPDESDRLADALKSMSLLCSNNVLCIGCRGHVAFWDSSEVGNVSSTGDVSPTSRSSSSRTTPRTSPRSGSWASNHPSSRNAFSALVVEDKVEHVQLEHSMVSSNKRTGLHRASWKQPRQVTPATEFDVAPVAFSELLCLTDIVVFGTGASFHVTHHKLAAERRKAAASEARVARRRSSKSQEGAAPGSVLPASSAAAAVTPVSARLSPMKLSTRPMPLSLTFEEKPKSAPRPPSAQNKSFIHHGAMQRLARWIDAQPLLPVGMMLDAYKVVNGLVNCVNQRLKSANSLGELAALANGLDGCSMLLASMPFCLRDKVHEATLRLGEQVARDGARETVKDYYAYSGFAEHLSRQQSSRSSLDGVDPSFLLKELASTELQLQQPQLQSRAPPKKFELTAASVSLGDARVDVSQDCEEAIVSLSIDSSAKQLLLVFDRSDEGEPFPMQLWSCSQSETVCGEWSEHATGEAHAAAVSRPVCAMSARGIVAVTAAECLCVWDCEDLELFYRVQWDDEGPAVSIWCGPDASRMVVATSKALLLWRNKELVESLDYRAVVMMASASEQCQGRGRTKVGDLSMAPQRLTAHCCHIAEADVMPTFLGAIVDNKWLAFLSTNAASKPTAGASRRRSIAYSFSDPDSDLRGLWTTSSGLSLIMTTEKVQVWRVQESQVSIAGGLVNTTFFGKSSKRRRRADPLLLEFVSDTAGPIINEVFEALPGEPPGALVPLNQWKDFWCRAEFSISPCKSLVSFNERSQLLLCRDACASCVVGFVVPHKFPKPTSSDAVPQGAMPPEWTSTIPVTPPACVAMNERGDIVLIGGGSRWTRWSFRCRISKGFVDSVDNYFAKEQSESWARRASSEEDDAPQRTNFVSVFKKTQRLRERQEHAVAASKVSPPQLPGISGSCLRPSSQWQRIAKLQYAERCLRKAQRLSDQKQRPNSDCTWRGGAPSSDDEAVDRQQARVAAGSPGGVTAARMRLNAGIPSHRSGRASAPPKIGRDDTSDEDADPHADTAHCAGFLESVVAGPLTVSSKPPAEEADDAELGLLRSSSSSAGDNETRPRPQPLQALSLEPEDAEASGRPVRSPSPGCSSPGKMAAGRLSPPPLKCTVWQRTPKATPEPLPQLRLEDCPGMKEKTMRRRGGLMSSHAPARQRGSDPTVKPTRRTLGASTPSSPWRIAFGKLGAEDATSGTGSDDSEAGADDVDADRERGKPGDSLLMVPLRRRQNIGGEGFQDISPAALPKVVRATSCAKSGRMGTPTRFWPRLKDAKQVRMRSAGAVTSRPNSGCSDHPRA